MHKLRQRCVVHRLTGEGHGHPTATVGWLRGVSSGGRWRRASVDWWRSTSTGVLRSLLPSATVLLQHGIYGAQQEARCAMGRMLAPSFERKGESGQGAAAAEGRWRSARRSWASHRDTATSLNNLADCTRTEGRIWRRHVATRGCWRSASGSWARAIRHGGEPEQPGSLYRPWRAGESGEAPPPPEGTGDLRAGVPRSHPTRRAPEHPGSLYEAMGGQET